MLMEPVGFELATFWCHAFLPKYSDLIRTIVLGRIERSNERSVLEIRGEWQKGYGAGIRTPKFIRFLPVSIGSQPRNQIIPGKWQLSGIVRLCSQFQTLYCCHIIGHYRYFDLHYLLIWQRYILLFWITLSVCFETSCTYLVAICKSAWPRSLLTRIYNPFSPPCFTSTFDVGH